MYVDCYRYYIPQFSFDCIDICISFWTVAFDIGAGMINILNSDVMAQ